MLGFVTLGFLLQLFICYIILLFTSSNWYTLSTTICFSIYVTILLEGYVKYMGNICKCFIKYTPLWYVGTLAGNNSLYKHAAKLLIFLNIVLSSLFSRFLVILLKISRKFVYTTCN